MHSVQIQYLKEYKKKMKKFCELSTSDHEHNTFTEDHMSTLTNIGFYMLGHNLRYITSSFDEDSTLIEVGAGTGVGGAYMLAGLFGEEFPSSCIQFTINDTDKKPKINRYIYTDPFNDLVDVPSQYKKKISIQWYLSDNKKQYDLIKTQIESLFINIQTQIKNNKNKIFYELIYKFYITCLIFSSTNLRPNFLIELEDYIESIEGKTKMYGGY